MAFGPDGSMYIADRNDHKIRRMAPNGVISTFAGTGTAGYNGDNLTATSARLSSPYSVDVDSDGNVYIADFDNERVRRVDPVIVNLRLITSPRSRAAELAPPMKPISMRRPPVASDAILRAR